MLKLSVIGIGAGNPEHMTVQAVKALNRADIVLLPRKGSAKEDLAELRREICRRYMDNNAGRIVEFDLPRRDGSDPYLKSVDDWHEAIAATYRDLLSRELPPGGIAAFLVWGDPSLYDSTLRILDRLRTAHRVDFELQVIPGITSVQALAASHAVPLNTIGNPVLYTTGRRLREAPPEAADTIIVMLDGDMSFRHVAGAGYDIYWGAYLGMENEMVIAGDLSEKCREIEEKRTAARDSNGWIMDVYMLRRKG